MPTLEKPKIRTREEHHDIFKSYPVGELKNIIKHTNISLTNKTKPQLVASMLKRRQTFNFLEKYNKKNSDKYKSHEKFKALLDEKEDEEEERDIKFNKKVRHFKGGGRSTEIFTKPKTMLHPATGTLTTYQVVDEPKKPTKAATGTLTTSGNVTVSAPVYQVVRSFKGMNLGDKHAIVEDIIPKKTSKVTDSAAVYQVVRSFKGIDLGGKHGIVEGIPADDNSKVSQSAAVYQVVRPFKKGMKPKTHVKTIIDYTPEKKKPRAKYDSKTGKKIIYKN